MTMAERGKFSLGSEGGVDLMDALLTRVLGLAWQGVMQAR